jgi:hypothetical protein
MIHYNCDRRRFRRGYIYDHYEPTQTHKRSADFFSFFVQDKKKNRQEAFNKQGLENMKLAQESRKTCSMRKHNMVWCPLDDLCVSNACTDCKDKNKLSQDGTYCYGVTEAVVTGLNFEDDDLRREWIGGELKVSDSNYYDLRREWIGGELKVSDSNYYDLRREWIGGELKVSTNYYDLRREWIGGELKVSTNSIIT